MICVHLNGSQVEAQSPQPETITDQTCSYVLVKPSEIEHSPFNLTVEQGAQIGGGIMLVCAIAFAFRAIARVIEAPPASSSEE